jgi:hypothetical protein
LDGALGVGDGRVGEAFFDAGDGVDGLGWGSVVVALEGLDEFGGGADDGDVFNGGV